MNNFYTEEEKQKIWNEIMYLRANDFGWNAPSRDQNAYDNKTGEMMLRNALQFGHYYRGVMDELHAYKSSIYIYGNKLCKWRKALLDYSDIYANISAINDRSSFITYYPGGGSEYKQHSDDGMYTMLSYFFQEPKNFTGGDFFVQDRRYEIHNGFTIIFPSWMKHGCTEIELIDKSIEGSGRYAVANFFFVNPAHGNSRENNYFFNVLQNNDGREIVLFDNTPVIYDENYNYPVGSRYYNRRYERRK